MLKAGERVRVGALGATYTKTAAAHLSGRLGTIEEVKTNCGIGESTQYLVRFDRAAPALYSNGMPVKAFHFPRKDLQKL